MGNAALKTLLRRQSVLSDPSPEDRDGQKREEKLLEAAAELYAEKGELKKHNIPYTSLSRQTSQPILELM